MRVSRVGELVKDVGVGYGCPQLLCLLYGVLEALGWIWTGQAVQAVHVLMPNGPCSADSTCMVAVGRCSEEVRRIEAVRSARTSTADFSMLDQTMHAPKPAANSESQCLS